MSPGLVQVLVSSGSITAAADQINLIDRIGQQDAKIVGRLRGQRATLERLRRQLLDDRATAASSVAAREREKARVEGLLAQRQAVLDSAGAELKDLLKAEEARKGSRGRGGRCRGAPAPSGRGGSRGRALRRRPCELDHAVGVTAILRAVGGAATDGANSAAASYALQFLGAPFVWGGASPSGFDCSGLATYVFAKYGKGVPHYTGAIWSAFPHVSTDQLQRGDMVFFHGLGHMGIYLGGDQFVHAPHTGDVVKVSQFSTYSGYVGAVRP